MDESFVDHLLLIIACVVAVEVFYKSKVLSFLIEIGRAYKKTLWLLRSSKIGDNWKEKMVPQYAMVVMKNSLMILSVLLLIVLAFLALSWISKSFLPFVVSCFGVLESMVVVMIYIQLRKRVAQ